MPAQNEDRDRQIVPRLRMSGVALRRGELIPLKRHSESPFSDAMVSLALKDFEESPSFSTAADFVSVAATLGRMEVARSAAQFVLDSPAEFCVAKRIAAEYLTKNWSGPAEWDGQLFNRDSLRETIHDIRLRLAAFPRNPILWSNLSVAYIALGLDKKAQRAIDVALTLAPTDRFIIRTASRLYLHEGDGDRAHSILLGAPQLKSDPWLLSAEIATSNAIGAKSAWVKKGQKFLESSGLRPFHLSELASALGTLLTNDGNLRQARKLVRSSLEQPTENANAQAAWLTRTLGSFEQLNPVQLDSSEAKAWLAREQEQWPAACDHALQWQHDQPFSSRPAILGSFIASSFLNNYDLAVQMAKDGLLCNPDDFILYNNCAFALAQKGQALEAGEMLKKGVAAATLTARQQVVYMATMGLIYYRSGNPEQGRRWYEDAIKLAKHNREVAEHVARANFALEEQRVGGELAASLAEETIAASLKVNDPVLKHVAKRLSERRGEVPKKPGWRSR